MAHSLESRSKPKFYYHNDYRAPSSYFYFPSSFSANKSENFQKKGGGVRNIESNYHKSTEQLNTLGRASKFCN